MESRYDPAEAARVVARLSPRVSSLLALRTYSARLIGSDPALVLHGGGNTSVKATATTALGDAIDVIHVKGSGWDLATIEPPGHPAVRLEPLRRLRALESLSDEAMVNELRTGLVDASSPTPSVETLLHAFLPARFVDHTHADAILALADQPDAERIFASLFGPGLVWIPYVMPGFALAKRCADAYERTAAHAVPVVMVLEKHGIFTWGETAQESYERMVAAVTSAERYAADHRGSAAAKASVRGAAASPLPGRGLEAVAFLPRLRGLLAKLAGGTSERCPIVRTRSTPAILAFLERPDAVRLVSRGCVTPDHVLRTKPEALLLPEPAYVDVHRLAAQIEAAVAEYAIRYRAYFDEMCRTRQVTRTPLDPWPRVVLMPGLGMCSVGSTAREADVALDVYEHTLSVMATAADVGDYQPCSRADLFDVEYWSLEQAKIKPAVVQPMSMCVALVTGAAGGIGRATATRMVAAGAHVALVDRDREALASAFDAVAATGKDRVLQVVADVRDAASVDAAVARTVAEWGGIDVVVSNAGTAPEGQLDTSAGEVALRDSLDINCLSHAHLARAAVAVMTAQGRGGCLLFNASKSAFNPGPGFGPYAIAKSALVALMRQLAVDLGARGIRSNAVNADRIRTGLFAGGVVESRASARGVSVEQYFRANLLGREVTTDDVADAFVYLATARSTTGCVVTVDGGNAAAFPR